MEDVVKQTEADFEKAWEEYGYARPEDRVLRRTARFFFFAGAQAGVAVTKTIHEDTYKELAEA